MSDEHFPLDRRQRPENRPMETERRLGLPEGRKVHAFVMREVVWMKRTAKGYLLRMRNGETRIIPDAEMAALAQQSYLPQVKVVEPGKPVRSVEDGGNGDIVQESGSSR